jgi:hypothetical protein
VQPVLALIAALVLASAVACGGGDDDGGRTALTVEVHRPPGPYRYALEVNRGWFQRHGFEPGDWAEVPDSVQAGE